MARFTLTQFRDSLESGHLRDDWAEKARGGWDIVETHDGHLALRPDCTEIDGDYYHEDEDSSLLVRDDIDDCLILMDDAIDYVGRYGQCKYTHKDNEDELHEYRGTFYDQEGLDHADLIILHDGDVCRHDSACYIDGRGYYHEDDCYYWESDGDWHLEPEPEESGRLFNYHDKARRDHSGDSRFKVGVEVEKEDGDVREDIDAEDIYDDYGFIVERDGSLDEESGFELVSPTLALDERTIEAFHPVRRLVNAKGSDACGGHIHFSESGKKGTETFEEFSPLIPLLYSLYPSRKKATYCEGKTKKRTTMDAAKYQAVRIFPDRIEFRIFPLIKNMNVLEWRLELLRLWSLHKPGYRKVMRLLRDNRSWLYVHLSKVCDASKKHSQYADELAYFIEVGKDKIRFNKIKKALAAQEV